MNSCTQGSVHILRNHVRGAGVLGSCSFDDSDYVLWGGWGVGTNMIMYYTNISAQLIFKVVRTFFYLHHHFIMGHDALDLDHAGGCGVGVKNL